MFEMDTDICQIWNASIDSNENGLYIIKNDNWYANIGEGGLVTIGFRTKDDEYKYYVYNFREKVMEMNCLFRERE